MEYINTKDIYKVSFYPNPLDKRFIVHYSKDSDFQFVFGVGYTLELTNRFNIDFESALSLFTIDYGGMGYLRTTIGINYRL